MLKVISASRTGMLLCGALFLWVGAPVVARADFQDPLSTPALSSVTPALEPMLAAALAGDHIVAVGARGVTLISGDDGASWTQTPDPVQSDLVDVEFPDATDGWICGHDGVLLHSTDGGASWSKQLDGVSAKTQFETYYNQQIAAGHNELSPDLKQIQLNYDNGPSLPWLGMWFNSAQNGYLVGSFGDIAVTNDGGKTWQPWLEHVDNPSFLNLNAIKPVGGTLYMVGEQGTVYALDPASQKFAARPTGYAGSLFGMTGTDKTLIVFGLRGNIFRSEDQGKSWVQSKNPAGGNITSGIMLADGRIALINIDGQILTSSDDGISFQIEPNEQSMVLADILQTAKGNVILTGLSGVKSVMMK